MTISLDYDTSKARGQVVVLYNNGAQAMYDFESAALDELFHFAEALRRGPDPSAKMFNPPSAK